jgi:large subunit ribosomal protein L4
VLHEVVKMQLANRRTARATVKHRSDVTGSTRKLFRQKGTGRARRGDVKSPLLKGGGVVFGPDGRKYTYKVPKKVRRLALKMALSSKYQEKTLRVINDFGLDEIKTQKFINIMNTLDLNKTLIISDKENRNLELSSRNVPEVKVMRTEGLNVYDILKYDYLVLMQGSLDAIEGRLLK